VIALAGFGDTNGVLEAFHTSIEERHEWLRSLAKRPNT
jgi:hypothetical protein